MKHTPHREMQAAGYAALCDLATLGKGKKSINVPVKTVKQMLKAYEDMLDILAFDEAKKRGAEYFPKELVDRLIAGENRLRHLPRISQPYPGGAGQRLRRFARHDRHDRNRQEQWIGDDG